MRFVIGETQVLCLRESKNPKTDETIEEEITSFDVVLDVIAPHVAALLRPEEINDLKIWLKERKKIQNEPAELQLLRTLPDMMREGAKVLNRIDNLDRPSYDNLVDAMKIFSKDLKRFDDIYKSEGSNYQSIDDDQVMKERLHSIRKDID